MAVRDTSSAPPGVVSELQLPGQFPQIPDAVKQRFAPAGEAWNDDLQIWYRKLRAALSENDDIIAESNSAIRRQMTLLTAEAGAFQATASQSISAMASEVEALAAAVLELSVSAGTKTSIGTSAPPTPNDGDIWWKVDGTDVIMMRYDGTTSTWVDVTDTRIPIISANLLEEQKARIDADSAMAGDLLALTSYVEGDLASAVELLQVAVGPEGALAESITDLNVAFGEFKADATLELGSLSDGVSANSKAVLELTATVEDNFDTLESLVIAEAEARADEDEALSSRIDALVVAAGVGIQTYYQSTEPDDYPNLNTGDLWFDTSDLLHPYRWNGSDWVSVRDGEIAITMAAVIDEQSARIDEDEALANSIVSISARLDTGDVATAISSLEAYAGPGGTLATSVTELSSDYGSFKSSTSSTLGTHTSVLGAHTTSINTLISQNQSTNNRTWAQATAPPIAPGGNPATQARIGDLWINTSNNWRLMRATSGGWVDVSDTRVSSAMSLITTEATTRATADGYLSGHYTLTVAAGNAVSGMRITSASGPGETISEVRFLADKFQIYNGSTGLAPFTVAGGKVRITGNLLIDPSEIGDGLLEVGDAAGDVNAGSTTIQGSKITTKTITADQIASGTITAAEIAALTITAAQIAAGTITGNKIAVQTITASNIATGTITAAQIAAGTITADKLATNLVITNTIRSSNYAAGSAGWQIDGTGAEFNTVTVRGTVISNSGVIAGWTLASNNISATNGTGGTTMLHTTDGFQHVRGTFFVRAGGQYAQGAVQTGQSGNVRSQLITNSGGVGELNLYSGGGDFTNVTAANSNFGNGLFTVNRTGPQAGSCGINGILRINGTQVLSTRYTGDTSTISGIRACLVHHGLSSN
jgi:hypothetical protein